MKTITIILITILGLSSNAQTPVKSLYDDRFEISGAYYKDIYNDLNRFQGTWMYSSGNNSLTIILQKKEMQFAEFGNLMIYQDILVGEYRFVENGQEKINTLENLNNDFTDPDTYNIAGEIIIKPSAINPDACMNCAPNDIIVITSFSDPERDIFGYSPQMIFHHFVENGVEKLRLTFRANSGGLTGLNGETNIYSEYNIPFGVYVLEKQE